MPTRVKLPDGSTGVFPDGMSNSDIEAVLQKQFGGQKQQAVAGAGALGLPQPNNPTVDMKPAGPGMDAIVGANPIGDSLSVVGRHLKNMVTGPYHAITDAPQGTAEKVIGNLGPAGLPLYRMLVKPSIDAGRTSVQQAKAGNVSGQEYDANKNYRPTAISSAVDAIPVAGPWARQIENDAQQHGAVPALLGMGTDILGPKAAGGVVKAAARTAGTATAITAADSASRNLALSRVLLRGTPGELLQSALKPGVKYGANAGSSLQEALPKVLAADPNLSGVSGFASAADTARDAAFKPYNDLVSPYRRPTALADGKPALAAGPFRPSAIDGNPIADAQMRSTPFMDVLERPGSPTWNEWRGALDTEGGIQGKTAEVANNYRKPLSVPQLDAIRTDANAKLHAFYNKAGGDQAAALSNPETARVKAVGDASREQLYPALESGAGLPSGSVARMQHDYGLLSDTSDIANKRDPVFSRHDPVSLSTKIVGGHGNPLSAAWNYVLQSKLGDLTDSDAQVNSAIDRFRNPSGTPLVARPGIGSKLALPIGQGLRAFPSVPLLANPMFLGKNTKKN